MRGELDADGTERGDNAAKQGRQRVRDGVTALPGRGRVAVARAASASRVAVTRRDGQAIVAGVGIGYLLGYLVVLRQLLGGTGTLGLQVAANPVGRAVESTGPFAFEPVALVDLVVVQLFVSPLNLAIGAGLAGLVGLNLAVTYLAYRHPAACGIDTARSNAGGTGAEGGAGLVAGLPALLSGAACCGPVVLLAVGVQASGLLLSVFGVLVPLAAVLLLGSLLYVARSVDPTLAA
jgi:hypothetical protein